MSTRRVRTVLLLVFGLIAALVPAGTAHAGGPGTWTKLATVNDGSDTVGMLRTSDGHLHLVWKSKPAPDHSLSYATATLSLAGSVLSTGTAVSKWDSLEYDPQLIRDGTGMRLVFEGATGTTGCHSLGLVYTATSANGSSWSIAPSSSLSFHSAGIGNLAATVESDGTTPVATFAGGHLFHEGLDTCPGSNADGTINTTSGSSSSNPATVTDPNDGSVWVAWFQSFKKQGYWVDQVLPSQLAPKEVPGSASTASKNNQPLQSVALAARAGGGEYVAFCVATSTKQCAHVDLWKVGSAAATVVPDSGTGNAEHVALAAGKQGRLTVLWYDQGQLKIHAVRTNTAATGFGVDRTIKLPAHSSDLLGLQAEGTFGRLDVIANVLANNLSVSLWHTQILAGLSLTANPTKFSHTAAHTVTFTVKDAGQAVGGVKVSCLGKTGTTNSSGQVKLTFPKGTATGKHVASAQSPDYNPGKVTITVT